MVLVGFLSNKFVSVWFVLMMWLSLLVCDFKMMFSILCMVLEINLLLGVIMIGKVSLFVNLIIFFGKWLM